MHHVTRHAVAGRHEVSGHAVEPGETSYSASRADFVAATITVHYAQLARHRVRGVSCPCSVPQREPSLSLSLDMTKDARPVIAYGYAKRGPSQKIHNPMLPASTYKNSGS